MTAAPVGDSSKQTFDQAYEELIDSERFQTEFSEPELPDPPVEPSEPPQWLIDLLEWFGQTGNVWQGGFWIIVAVLASILLFFLGRTLFQFYNERAAREAGEGAVEEEWRPEESVARTLLADADALAKEGRYAEAARLLLHRSVQDIEDKLPDFLRPALTSRDIADSETVPGPARGAFSTIAGVVERGIFAMRPVDETGWGEARQAYEKFAFGENWR